MQGQGEPLENAGIRLGFKDPPSRPQSATPPPFETLCNYPSTEPQDSHLRGGEWVGGLVLKIIIPANICCVPDIAPNALHMLPLQSLHLPCEVSAINSRNLLSNESKTGGLLIEEIFKAGHLRIHKTSTLLNVMLVRVHLLGDLLMQSQSSLRPGPPAKALPCVSCIERTWAAVCGSHLGFSGSERLHRRSGSDL